MRLVAAEWVHSAIGGMGSLPGVSMLVVSVRSLPLTSRAEMRLRCMENRNLATSKMLQGSNWLQKCTILSVPSNQGLEINDVTMKIFSPLKG